MDIATLCNTYQRKMWKSMISRNNLEFSIWDVITIMDEKVYYMPYSGHLKFQVLNQQCRKCSSVLDIRFRKDEFIAATCKCSSDNKNYATIEKLTTLFAEVEATKILNQFSDRKTRNLSNKLQKWIALGYTKNEAIDIVKLIQSDRSAKSPATQPGVKEYSIRCKEYWIKQGYSIEDALLKVSEAQIGNGLQWYISRYGEIEGKARYEDRIARWIISYNSAIEHDPTILERKMVKLGRASKQSLKIFEPVYNKYKHRFKIYLGVDDNVEYFLRDGKTLYFYDFTIPELKIIVEFNGSAWHPNCNILSELQIRKWRGIFNNVTADIVLAKDFVKRSLAELNGYTVVIVWDTDNITTSIDKIEQLIEKKCES
jgi:hypothetical protein